MTLIQWQMPRSRVRHHTAQRALSGGLDRVFGTLREWRRRMRDRARLAELDDRTLRDIGITRTDAEFLINKPFWRE